MNIYVNKQFSFQYKSTIGADFLTKEVNIDNKVVQLQLWDTAGTEKFNSMGNQFYRNAECCILVYDLTDVKTFETIDSWKNEFLNQLNPKNPESFPFILLGNKCDRVSERKVQENKIKQYCQNNNNMPFIETSAKDNTNVDKAFELGASLALKRNSEDDEIFIPQRVEIKPINQPKPKKRCC